MGRSTRPPDMARHVSVPVLCDRNNQILISYFNRFFAYRWKGERMNARSQDGQPNGRTRRATGELSGSRWAERFRGSSSLRDLKGPFRDRAEAFVEALRASGASVTISATYRPPQRAYLMHWCWMIVKRNVDPATVPAMDGVDINWTHDDARGNYSRQASVNAARAMVEKFNIQSLGVAPALHHRETISQLAL